MKRMYFMLAFFGFVVPYYFFIRFILNFGFDLMEMGNQLFASDISTCFAVDLIVVAVVFLIFSYFNSRRMGMKRWWIYLVATLVAGPSFSIPFYLGVREKYQ
ncbi:MAG: DUF2834 domain-containing protein [Candidatus Aminicenantes bacterium]|nr:DUF2834 domain-containing protein [Candidatus Aminicenantes bacterium]